MEYLDPDKRKALGAVVEPFIAFVASWLEAAPSHLISRSGLDAHDRSVMAAEEVEELARSFIASDHHYFASELLPTYAVLGRHLDKYSQEELWDKQLDQDERDDLAFREADLWKYTPSAMFSALLRGDREYGTTDSVEYGERCLAIALTVCMLDDDLADQEAFDLKEFASMLVDALDAAGVAPRERYDAHRRVWTLESRSSMAGQQQASASAADLIDEIVDVFFGDRMTASAARLALADQPVVCATDGCGLPVPKGRVRCDACSLMIVAVRIEGEWVEIEPLDDGEAVAPTGGCPCGAAYLFCERRGPRVSLTCSFCKAAFRVRAVRRYLLTI